MFYQRTINASRSHVDSTLLSTVITVMSQVKSRLSFKFKMKDLGLASHFLGISVNQTSDSIMLDLAKYITDIFKCFSMENCKSAPTPLPSVNLSVFNESDPKVDFTLYHSIIDKLTYTANAARPDLATAVSFISRYIQAPKVMIVDMFTKPFGKVRFPQLRSFEYVLCW